MGQAFKAWFEKSRQEIWRKKLCPCILWAELQACWAVKKEPVLGLIAFISTLFNQIWIEKLTEKTLGILAYLSWIDLYAFIQDSYILNYKFQCIHARSNTARQAVIKLLVKLASNIPTKYISSHESHL